MKTIWEVFLWIAIVIGAIGAVIVRLSDATARCPAARQPVRDSSEGWQPTYVICPHAAPCHDETMREVHDELAERDNEIARLKAQLAKAKSHAGPLTAPSSKAIVPTWICPHDGSPCTPNCGYAGTILAPPTPTYKVLCWTGGAPPHYMDDGDRCHPNVTHPANCVAVPQTSY